MKISEVEVLKRAAVATLLDCHPRTVINREKEGLLNPIRMNSRCVVYRKSEVLALLNSKRATRPPAPLQRAADGGFTKNA
jgi:hypothetical protein